MTLSAFIAFVLGMTVEILLLAEQALPPEKLAALQHFRVRGLTPMKSVSALLAAGVVVIISGLELVGWGRMETSMDNGLVGAVFVIYGVFIFFAGIMGNILPRVNETSILTTQILVALGIWANGTALNPWLIVFLVALPALVTTVLVIKHTPLKPVGKALVYFWYLLCLIVLIYENGSLEYFNHPELTIFDGFTGGMLFIFLILHALFSIRFFLITSSLIVPRNRPLVGHLMPHLFSDEQIAPRTFALLFGLVLGLLLLNAWLNVVNPVVLLNVSVLICVQFLFRSQVA